MNLTRQKKQMKKKKLNVIYNKNIIIIDMMKEKIDSA